MSEVKVNKISPRTGTDVELNSSAKITNFTSTGIDDNATSTAITIDTSQNLLVGKTTTTRTDVGSEMRPTGFIRGTREDGHPFDVVRTNSDGDIMKFYRDAGQVGQITAYTTGISINLGGTGSANTLDDYEEGTWTPTFNNFSASVTKAEYVKIGKLVNIQLYCVLVTSGTGSNSSITNLPFSAMNEGYAPFIVNGEFSSVGFTYHVLARVNGNSSEVVFMNNNNQRITGANLDSTSFMTMQFSYFTDS